MLTVRGWRRLRDQAGELQYIIAAIQERDGGRLREAEKIYKQWLEGGINYREAWRMLEKLAGE